DFENLIGELYARPESPPHGFRALIAPGSWSGRGETAQLPYLPKTVLAYTTGALQPWRDLWTRNPDGEGVDLVSQSEDYDTEQERPPGWTPDQERQFQLRAAVNEGADSRQAPARSDSDASATDSLATAGAWSPILITDELLKLALLAVALPVGLKDIVAQGSQPADEHESLRELLKRAGWRWPVSVAVRVDFQPDAWREDKLRRLLPWFYAAGEVIAQPHPSTLRHLHFDLRGPFDPSVLPENLPTDLRNLPEPTQGHALLALMGGAGNSTAYERFERLRSLHEEGLIAGVSLCLRKDDTDDLLRFDELSDGEQMVLGRMALFFLLQDQQDCLLLLDEPETHFNDKWKRDIVAVVEEALGNNTNEVIISTHAALVLTDALKEEILLMERTQSDGSILKSLGEDVHTFGATGDHPLRDIFGASDTVGLRASRLLEVLLAASAHADLVESYWGNGVDLAGETVRAVLATARPTEQDISEQQVIEALQMIARFAGHFGVPKPLRMTEVVDKFIEQTGPGYFQIELKRAWRKLKERDTRATQT
ncbi:MAG: hypothetical protein FIA96_01660, partial [Betaproteobacteria bacterium]|nr:hypothetical protein [Betaproteobacteria bacterium]